MIELVFGQVLEALYFVTFMMVSKNFRTKRVLFTVLSVSQYLLLCNIFAYDIKFQFFYIFTFYGIMKWFYKERVQLTDIFLFLYSIFVLVITNGMAYFTVYYITDSLFLANIVAKIMMFSYIYYRRDPIRLWYKRYYTNWNRKPNQKIRSLTIRNASLMFMYSIILILELQYVFLLLVGR